MKKSKFITTPIYYANAEAHIGHAYTSILADAIHRYAKVWENRESFFLTGMDEHGQKIADKAKSENVEVMEFVQKWNESFKNLYSLLNVKYDRFIRTTDTDHEEVVKAVWNKFLENNDLYEKEYVGMYCVGCESFKTEKDLNEKGECPDHLKKPIELKEKNWFFKLSKYQMYLNNLISTNKLKIIPEYRKTEILNFINGGLQDISFSRSSKVVSWGIPVPNDDTQTIYVWCDALTNYISACNYRNLNLDNKNDFQKMWNEGNTLHLMGKDILKFHAIYWPAMLHSLGVEAPKEIMVHGMITSAGSKMSKTVGNVIDPINVIKNYNALSENSVLGENLGSEFFRYFVLKNVSPFSDGDVTMERMKEMYNADLANGLGNLVSRVVKLSEKYLQGVESFKQVELEKEHSEFVKSMENYDVMNAMNHIWKLIGEADNYMQTEQPFKTVKVDEEKGKVQLEFLREKVYTIARLLNPFMPTTSEMIKNIVKENKMPEKPLFPRYE
jgi:methionyl-tRNA synthetase